MQPGRRVRAPGLQEAPAIEQTEENERRNGSATHLGATACLRGVAGLVRWRGEYDSKHFALARTEPDV
jgi:hypothetical protein